MNAVIWFFFSFLLLGVAYVCLFKTDWVWEWHVNRQLGLGIKRSALKRNVHWETNVRVYALFMLFAGVASLLAAIATL